VTTGSPAAGSDAPIGVFDSGVGGLTVLRALRAELPGESFTYLGDTARLPYGTKSPETVVRYALQAADYLVARGIKALVVACNTASAAALPALRQRFANLPVFGVIEPGARAACAATRSAHIIVLATEGTVRGGAYQTAIRQLLPQAQVDAIACQIFVALAEEGWVEGKAVDAAIARYLEPLNQGGSAPDTLVLGCTHFPVLRERIAAAVGSQIRIIDSAATTAAAVREHLLQVALTRAPKSNSAAPRAGHADTRFLATDGVLRFAAVGARFLGEAIAVSQIELIDL
jgi:glutamate racemase